MRLLPYVAMFVCGYTAWGVGRFAGRFTGILLAIVASALGFYYARKFQRDLLD